MHNKTWEHGETSSKKKKIQCLLNPKFAAHLKFDWFWFETKQKKKSKKKCIVHDFVLIGQTALHLIGIIFSWRHYLRPFKCIWNSYNELDDWTAPLDFPNNCMVIASSTGFIFRKWLSFRTLLVTVHHLLLGQTVSFLFVNVMNCERIVCKRQLKPSIDI